MNKQIKYWCKSAWNYMQLVVAILSCSLGALDMIRFGYVKNFSLYLFMMWLGTLVISDMSKKCELHITVNRGDCKDE